MAVDTKPQKLVNYDFEHDGHAIRFVEVPRWTYGDSYAHERRRWEIHIDGAFVGYARKPYGFGKQAFLIDRLTESYSSVFGDREFLRGHYENKRYELVDLLPLIVEGRTSESRYQKLVTQEQADAAEALHREKQERDKAESVAREERERKQRYRDLTEQVEQKTAEIEALEGVAARESMSNVERMAIETALKLMRAELRSVSDSLRRMDEWAARRRE